MKKKTKSNLMDSEEQILDRAMAFLKEHDDVQKAALFAGGAILGGILTYSIMKSSDDETEDVESPQETIKSEVLLLLLSLFRKRIMKFLESNGK